MGGFIWGADYDPSMEPREFGTWMKAQAERKYPGDLAKQLAFIEGALCAIQEARP